jgi:alpha,alpha-trehalase
MFLLLALTSALAQAPARLEINPTLEIKQLLKTWDQDRDQKITVRDQKKGRSLSYTIMGNQVDGVYHVSNLLQELKLAQEEGRKEISGALIFEPPVKRISRSIRDRYWDALTRRIDKDHLRQVLGDPKIKSEEESYLYVPYHDIAALEYYLEASAQMPELKLNVIRLPEKITPEFVKGLGNKHGLLVLDHRKGKDGKLEGVPYVVPGGRFNEMYGWDSYFEVLGLLIDGRVDLARSMVDNFVYQITHYGKILNANRTYYLTRSQPPFLTSMIRAVLKHLPKGAETRQWLETSLRAAVKEYHSVWMGEDRLTSTGLSRYHGNGLGVPPEVEPGHFDHVANRNKLQKYNRGEIKDESLDLFFMHDRAVRESGHDTTYRWRHDGKDVASDFVTVDLNSLLYKFELDLAHLIEKELGGKFEGVTANDFLGLAAKRKVKMLELLWDSEKKMFFDYNHRTQKRSTYVSATTLWPLWAHDPSRRETKFLSDKDADLLVKNALKELEEAGGVASTSKRSTELWGDKKHARQWDWPNGWAPHQMLIWEGLKNYEMNNTAQRLCYKWLYMITRNAMDFNGTVTEKYDVVNRSHAVFAEYGNVGADFSYITKEGFGWMNASYQVGLETLTPANLTVLEKVIPPEWVSFGKMP